jgi:hypothetical protein
MSADVTDPCGICEGSPGEHDSPNVQHVWVPQGNTELITKAEAAKKRAQSQRQPMMVLGSQNQVNEAVGRLVEVLLGQKMISTEEALYVAGMGPKPDYTPASGFRDPAVS